MLWSYSKKALPPAKVANSVFTQGLHNKLQQKRSNIRACAAHPGGSDTSLGDELNLGMFMKKVVAIASKFMLQSPADGTTGLLTGMMLPKAEYT